MIKHLTSVNEGMVGTIATKHDRYNVMHMHMCTDHNNYDNITLSLTYRGELIRCVLPR